MISIKKATIADIETIQNIAKITWQPTYLHIIGQQQIDYMLAMMYNKQILQQQITTNHTFFIAEQNNKSLAFAGVSKETKDIFKLNKLYVLPTEHKKGLGKILLQTVIEFVKKQQGKKIELQVNRQNNAKDFYEKNGFTILYQADFEIGNGYFMNDYVMGLNV